MHVLSSNMFTATVPFSFLAVGFHPRTINFPLPTVPTEWVYCCSALHSEGYSIGAKRLHCGVVDCGEHAGVAAMCTLQVWLVCQTGIYERSGYTVTE